MVFERKHILKGYRAGIIWRVLLLSATLFLLIWLIIRTEYFISPAVTGLVAAGLVINLVRFSERTNEELIRFLDSIRYNDYTQSFTSEKYGKSFGELRKAFTRIADQFRKERAERQESVRYLETVIQHIGIGLLSFDSKGDISLINNSAKQMLDLASLKNIDQLKNENEKLRHTLSQIKGGNKTLVQLDRQGESMHWSIYATEFVKGGEHYKLVSIQNISNELNEKEMEAWQNLTQVLAHEIMNSITPIASLTDTVNMIVSNKVWKTSNDVNTIDSETLRDVKDALSTINKRSHGLMRFVMSYRDFTRIPDPDLKKIRVDELLDRVSHLMKGEFDKTGISASMHVEPVNLVIYADPELIEQVLINLTRNAFRALTGTEAPEIRYEAGMTTQGKAEIRVRDNGPGIKEQMLEKIFIPFFTSATADGSKGSGIGLSLSRQIMRSHHGTLTVNSGKGEGAVFILRF